MPQYNIFLLINNKYILFIKIFNRLLNSVYLTLICELSRRNIEFLG